jgi:hypothetical protein
MANPRLEYFLSQITPDWAEFSPELKNQLLTENSDPYKLEQYILQVSPDMYIEEQNAPGTVRQMAGDITGGSSLIDKAISLPGQTVGAIAEGVGGLIQLAGSDTLAQFGEDVRQYNTPAYGSDTGRFLGGTSVSVAQNLGMLGGAALAAPLMSNPMTGVPILTAGLMSATAGGQGVREYLKVRPEDTAGAALYGLAAGGAELAGEMIAVPGMSNLLKAPGLKSAAGLAVSEIFSENATTGLNILTDTVANRGVTPDRVVGDVTTPMAERFAETTLGTAISLPFLMLGGSVISPRIRAAQVRMEARQAAVESTNVDKLVESGVARVVTPFMQDGGAALPTTGELDATLIRGLENLEAHQKADIADFLIIIDELQARGTPEAAAEAQAFMDDLFGRYDPVYIESVMDQHYGLIEEQQAQVADQQAGIAAEEDILAGDRQAAAQAAPAMEEATRPPEVNVTEPARAEKEWAYAAADVWESLRDLPEGSQKWTKAAKKWISYPQHIQETAKGLVESQGIPSDELAKTLLGDRARSAENIRWGAETGTGVLKTAQVKAPGGRAAMQVMDEATGKMVTKPTPSMREAANKAADTFERMQSGDVAAQRAWNAITDERLKRAAPGILAARKAKVAPGKKVVKTLLGTEALGADEVAFQSRTGYPKPGQAVSIREETPAERQRTIAEIKQAAQARQAVDTNERILRPQAQVGDVVSLTAPYKQRPAKYSSVLGQNMLTGAKILEQTPEGNYRVEVADSEKGVQEFVVTPEMIVPRAVEGIRNLDTQLGPLAPHQFSLLKATKELMTDLKGWVRIMTRVLGRSDMLGEVTVRKVDGTPVRMRLDYALASAEGLLEKTIAHEIGHITAMVAESTRIPGMDQHRAEFGSLLGDLVGEWYPLEQFMTIQPYEMGPGVDMADLYQKQSEFEQQVYEAAQGREINYQDILLMQQNWNNLTRAASDRFLTPEEQKAINEKARAQVTLTGDKTEGALKRAKEQARNEMLDSKGLAAGYMVRREMESVVLKMRGLEDTGKMRLELSKAGSREIYADFFAAKLLDLYTHDKAANRWVSLAGQYAPTASRMFDNYLDRKPKTREVLERIRTQKTDVETQVKYAMDEMAKVDQQAADRIRLQYPDQALLMETWKQRWLTGGMQQLVDRNFPLYQQVRETKGRTAEVEIREANEQLAGISSVIHPFMKKSSDLFDRAIQALREADPENAGNAEGLMGAYMMYRRIAEGGRTTTTTQTITDADGNQIDIKQDYDMFSAAMGGRANAQAVLDSHPIFSSPKYSPILDQTLTDFHALWVSEILNPAIDSGLISKDQGAILKGNVFYATYAIEHEMFGAVQFKAVTPAIKAQTGTLQSFRNPIAATLEKGNALRWQAALNIAKQQLIDGLAGSEWVKDVTHLKQGSAFPMPVDQKNWSLITLKRDGKDFGYHVPTIFSSGVDFQQRSHLQSQFLQTLGASSNYFRQLYTTWNPKFIGKNAFRDFTRMVIRSVDPTNARGLGLGIIPQYANTIIDMVRGITNKEVRAAMDAERLELYHRAVIMSEYDFRARDAQDTSAYQNLIRQHSMEARQREGGEAERSALGRFLSKYLMGRAVNSVADKYTNFMEGVSRGIEYLPKHAAYRYYSQNKHLLSDAEFNQMVRKSGSPYFLNHGEMHPLTSNVFMFFNPAMQSMYEDLTLMRDKPVVAAKFALATSMTLGFSMGVIQAMAMLGADGDKIRKLFMGIPEADLDSGICIPIGSDTSGRTNYFHLPVDEGTGMFTRIARRLLQGELAKALVEPIGQVTPSPQPAVHLASYITTLMAGFNPINYRFNPSIPQTDFAAGGWTKWRHLVKEIYNTVSPTTPFWRMRNLSAMDEAQSGTKSASNPIAQATGWLTDFPIASAVTLGLLKSSNRGIEEHRRRAVAGVEQATAQASNIVAGIARAAQYGDREAVGRLVNTLTDLDTGNAGSNAIVVANALKQLDDKLKQRLIGGSSDEYVVKFINSSKAEQLALLAANWPMVAK